MAAPLLLPGHAWHRQRAQQRSGRGAPPPLVAAGLDLEHDPAEGRGVSLGGLAVIFGHFPADLQAFLELARTRLHLQPGQARELDPVLNTRILALWAWLPGPRLDCYLEFDRATGQEEVWTLGPGADGLRPVGPEDVERLDRDFADAWVLNGPAHWGGASGLQRMVERHGLVPLLAAARVADLLEHRPQEPLAALEAAQERWPRLDPHDELPWADLAGSEPPWACVQLGRLALRLGLLRAARVLLLVSGGGEVAPIAHFDLGQACEALGDLAEAEQAFVRFAAARPRDADAWRRLLLLRLRLDRGLVAEETLRRYRAAGGSDEDLARRWIEVGARGRLRLGERARLAAWHAARLDAALAEIAPLADLLDEWCVRRPGLDAAALRSAAAALVRRLAAALDGAPPGRAEALARCALLALPLAGPLHPAQRQATEADLAGAVRDSLAACCRYAQWPPLDAPLPLAALVRLVLEEADA